MDTGWGAATMTMTVAAMTVMSAAGAMVGQVVLAQRMVTEASD